jgi:hypothetical protein
MEKTAMEFPHQGRSLTAIHPFFGPANSKTLLEELGREKYSEPTLPELASFIHHYYHGFAEAGEVNEIMRTKYFVGYTGIIYLPQEKEICFIDYPAFDRGSVVDIDDLITRMRFREIRAKVSLENIESGSLPWNKIAGNPLFIALCGEEGAEKIAEIASRHPDQRGFIFVPEFSNFTSPQARIPLVYSYNDGRSLTVTLNGSGNGINGYTPGLK